MTEENVKNDEKVPVVDKNAVAEQKQLEQIVETINTFNSKLQGVEGVQVITRELISTSKDLLRIIVPFIKTSTEKITKLKKRNEELEAMVTKLAKKKP